MLTPGRLNSKSTLSFTTTGGGNNAIISEQLSILLFEENVFAQEYYLKSSVTTSKALYLMIAVFCYDIFDKKDEY